MFFTSGTLAFINLHQFEFNQSLYKFPVTSLQLELTIRMVFLMVVMGSNPVGAS